MSAEGNVFSMDSRTLNLRVDSFFAHGFTRDSSLANANFRVSFTQEIITEKEGIEDLVKNLHRLFTNF